MSEKKLSEKIDQLMSNFDLALRDYVRKGMLQRSEGSKELVEKEAKVTELAKEEYLKRGSELAAYIIRLEQQVAFFKSRHSAPSTPAMKVKHRRRPV